MSKEAMKLALDALQEVYWSSRSAKHDEAITALRKALAEQQAPEAQHEPVAWMSDRAVGFKRSEFGATSTVPLYTTPQAQPALEPLTDEQMAKAWAVADGEHNASASVKRRITRAIEAARNIKENQS